MDDKPVCDGNSGQEMGVTMPTREELSKDDNIGLGLFDSKDLNHSLSKENNGDDVSENISMIADIPKDVENPQENDIIIEQEITTPQFQNKNLELDRTEPDHDNDVLKAKKESLEVEGECISDEYAKNPNPKHSLELGVCGSQVNSTPESDSTIASEKSEEKTFLTPDDSSHEMPFSSNKNQGSKPCIKSSNDNELQPDTIQDDDDADSKSTDEEEKFKGERIIDLGGIEIPEMLSPKSRIEYINDMRKQLGNLITKGPSIVATNLLHGVSEPPIGSPKDKTMADIDTWEVLTPSSSVSSSMADFISPDGQTLHGTLTREGDMVSFVADDIMEKIRQSASPMASSRGSPASSITASAPDTPLIISRGESFSRSAIPPIDPAVITDIEKHCMRVADSLDLMLGNLTGSIHNMSAITVGHIQTYKDASDKVGFTVDQSVKAMYSLIAKCEQLNKMMEPVEDLAQQIKGIKRLLDELEFKCK